MINKGDLSMTVMNGFDAHITDILKNNKGTALQYLLFDSSGEDLAYGNISLSDKERYDRDTVYGIASVTKSFVALSEIGRAHV